MSRRMCSGFRVWATMAVVIFVWGITFVDTRALLADFSALEILVVRFGLTLSWSGWGRSDGGTTRGCGILLARR